MSAPASLRRNFGLTLFGNLAYGAAQWAMLMALAKLGEPELVGRFALALGMTAPIMMFANLNLGAVLATDRAAKHPFEEYLGLRLAAVGLACAAIAALAAAQGPGQLAVVVLLVGAAKAFESLSDLFFGLMQRHERMDGIARSMLVKSVVSLALFSATMSVTRSLVWACAALALAWLGTLVLWDVGSARRAAVAAGEPVSLRPSWRPAALKALALTALPLGFADLLHSLLANAPRYFVGGMLGERELGIFAAMAYVLIIGARVTTALAASALPRLAKLHHAGDFRGYSRLLARLVGVGALLGAAGMLVAAAGGRTLLTLLYRPEYAGSLDAFLWLTASGGVGAVGLFLQYGMMGAQRFWAQPLIVLAATLVLAAVCGALIPRYGLAGAAIAVFASSVVKLACNAFVVYGVLADLRRRAA